MVNNYEGMGVAEAPRGMLIHDFKVDTQRTNTIKQNGGCHWS